MMDTANVAIFERNEGFLKELCEFFGKTNGFRVCAKATTGDTALEALQTSKPDVAIIDATLRGIDGIKLLDHINKIYPQCHSFITSEFDNDRILNSAIAHGAIYYFIKPVTPEVIGERVADILDEMSEIHISANYTNKRKLASLDEKISNIFVTIGIPPHIKGYTYMREGIKMTVEKPAIINKVTKELYPKIALKYSTTPSKVERAIRHAIEVAWNRGRSDAISSIFGARIYIGNERPTNSEFIALVADKLMLENLI